MGKFLCPLFTFAAVALFALVSCSSKPEKLVSETDSGGLMAERADVPAELAQELKGVRYSQSKKGKLQWELEAKSVEQVADEPMDLEKVKITYYSDENRVTTLSADYGSYDTVGRNATFRGNIVVRTYDGNRLRADILKWNQESGILKGEGDVTITRGDSVIKGTGFELSPELETFKICEVEGTILQRDMNR